MIWVSSIIWCYTSIIWQMSVSFMVLWLLIWISFIILSIDISPYNVWFKSWRRGHGHIIINLNQFLTYSSFQKLFSTLAVIHFKFYNIYFFILMSNCIKTFTEWLRFTVQLQWIDSEEGAYANTKGMNFTTHTHL